MNRTDTIPWEGNASPDDSWWASLIATEEQFTVHHPAAAPTDAKPALQEKAASADISMAEGDWALAARLFEHDETVEMKVMDFNRGGLLVEGSQMHGFVPLSHLVEIDPETTQEVKEQVMAAYVGRLICLKVIECNPERGRVVFSQRAALAGAGRRNWLFETLQIGQCVNGVVTNVTDFGVFLDMGGLEGLIHVSELSWGRVRHPTDVAQVGQTCDALVINVDRQHARVALSLKRLHANPWESARERYFAGQIVEATITSLAPFGAFARLEEGLDGLIHISEIANAAASCGHTPANPLEILREGQVVRARVLQVDANRQRLGLSLLLPEAETADG